MRQNRTAVKKLRATARTGDLQSLLLLLTHSVSCGHKRLSVRRYLIARALGATELGPVRAFCRRASQSMTLDEILDAARMAARSASEPTGVYDLASELIGLPAPLTLSYEGQNPMLNGPPRVAGTGACIIGRSEIGARLAIGPRAVIRADGHFVRIGDDFSIGSASTVHIAHGVLPAIIGNRVTVGDNACVHACTVGNDCVIGHSVVILDGSIVENDVVIEDGATVFPRARLAGGFVYGGSPAKAIRKLEIGERNIRALQLREAVGRSIAKSQPEADGPFASHSNFVASNAVMRGDVRLDANSSVFFSCRLDAQDGSITIGKSTNIQDNTRIESLGGGKTVVGANTTIGHNVSIQNSEIGNSSLIGIGSSLSPDTIVEDDVLVAAGATTSTGQRLHGGWVWGGRPARPIAKLDDAKRQMMGEIIGHYCRYAQIYHDLQKTRLSS